MRDAWMKVRGWLLEGCWQLSRLLRWRLGQWWVINRQVEHATAVALAPRRRR